MIKPVIPNLAARAPLTPLYGTPVGNHCITITCESRNRGYDRMWQRMREKVTRDPVNQNQFGFYSEFQGFRS
jgi:hypothetical protein